MTGALVLKLGGELIETAAQRARVAACAVEISASRPLVIVHGGGRAIDVELARRGLAPKKVDGLRVTDADALDVVVSVLAGAANTSLVASLVAAGVPAVGLTGVDAGLGRAVRIAAHQSAAGPIVDLGLVGDPDAPDLSLLNVLLGHGYVPVIASLGLDATPGASAHVLNVNADVMACRLAAAMDDATLVIAGATAGVYDERGASLPTLDAEGIDAIVDSGTATAGMVAKLAACRTALSSGVARVRIIDGRSLDAGFDLDRASGTTLVLAA